VNRNKALEAYYQQGRVTCQIMPPNFLGYRPFCPYALDPNDAGTWDAPDVSKAARLVAESGTRPQLIHMAEWEPFGDVARYVASVLRSLGYRVSLKLFPASDFGSFYAYVADSRSRVDMAGFWVLSPSTSPAAWFTSDLTCASRVFASPNNFNTGFYCNPKLDAEMAHAADVQLTDPAASAPLWAKIDQEATLDAPWLSLFTQGGVEFVSKRVGNYQHNPVYQILLDQLWVT
jgi:peptide/nickel transport system substrate-binding protein